jgi:hypothetical protein
MRLRGFAIAHFVPERLDALCGMLRANDRAPTLATYPSNLWRICAERGFAEAQYGLALMIDEGVVFPFDAREAYIWAYRAGQGLSPLAARLQGTMRPLELEDAMRVAQDWAPTR